MQTLDLGAQPSAAGLQTAIVASRFNPEIMGRLIEGAMAGLAKAGGAPGDVLLVRVPGAYEIPLAMQKVALARRFDAIVALGCVIRGETPHFEHISRYAVDAVGRVALECKVAVGFGVLTVETDEQAIARSGPDETNKGFEAALAAVEMAQLLRKL